jgi:hypothetical protein
MERKLQQHKQIQAHNRGRKKEPDERWDNVSARGIYHSKNIIGGMRLGPVLIFLVLFLSRKKVQTTASQKPAFND